MNNFFEVENVDFVVGGNTKVKNMSFSIEKEGDIVCLLGPSGIGKTTILRAIAGLEKIKNGHIKLKGKVLSSEKINIEPENRNISLAFQENSLFPHYSVEKNILLGAEKNPDNKDKKVSFNEIVDLLDISKILNQYPHQISAGEAQRASLARSLLSKPDLLLLDEPTNYLDLEGTIWLENYLATYPHTVLVISHDRNLLNNCVNSILHLEDKNLTYYSGNYEKFAETKMVQLESKLSEIKKQDKTRQHLQSFVDRFRYKATKAKQAQSRLKALSKLKTISLPQEKALKKILFPAPEELASPLVSIEDGSTGYNDKAVLTKLNLRIDFDDKIALLGKNGEGKSTLSKLLADRIPLLSGSLTKSSQLRIGYFSQNQTDELRRDETPFEHLSRAKPSKNISERKNTSRGARTRDHGLKRPALYRLSYGGI